MENKDKLLRIIKEIQKMYPELNRLMLDDLDNPNQIVITSDAHMEAIAEEAGVDIDLVDEYYIEEYDEEEDDPRQLDLLDWDGNGNDNNGDGGPLQWR